MRPDVQDSTRRVLLLRRRAILRAPHARVPLRLRETLPAAALAALLAGAFLGEAVLRPDRILASLDHSRSHLPWSARAEGFLPRNPELADHALAFDPFLRFLHREVSEGRGLPLWNPHQFGGIPALGNPQFGHFSPFRALALAMPVERSYAFQAWTKLAAAALGAYFLARTLGRSVAAAALAGIAFGFAGYPVLWLGFPLSDSAVFAPWVFLALEAHRRSPSLRAIAGIALALGLSILGGHPETAFFVGAFAGLHVLGASFPDAWLDGAGAAFRWMVARVGGLALGVALAAISFLPTLEYLHHSVARAMRQTTLDVEWPWSAGIGTLAAFVAAVAVGAVAALRLARAPRAAGAMRAGALLGVAIGAGWALGRKIGLSDHALLVLSPDLFGHPMRPPGYHGPSSYVQTAASYTGVLPLVLAVVGLFVVPRGHARWKATAIASLVLLWNVPLLASAMRSLPPFSLAEPSRVAPLWNLSCAILAAFALDAILASAAPARRLLAGLGAAALVATGFALLAGGTSLPGPAPAEVTPPGGRVLGFHEGGPGRGPILRFEGWVTGLRAGERVEVELDRGDEARFRMAAALRTAPGTPEATLAGFQAEFARRDLPEGLYRRRGRIVGRPGESPVLFDGGVVEVRREASIPDRTILLAGASLAALAILLAARSRARSLAVLLVAGVDLALFGVGFNPTVARWEGFPPTGAEEFLRSDPDLWGPQRQGRIWTEGGAFPPNTATRIGLLDVRNYDAIDLERFAHVFLALSRRPELFPARWTLEDLHADSPAFALLGVKVVVTPRILDRPDLRLVFDGETRVYRNENFRGLAILAPAVQRPGEARDIESIDPTRAALLEEPVEIASPFREGSARVVRHEPDRVVVRASLDGEGILVLLENHFPGWEVEVDGEPAELLRAFWTFRAVKLGPGDHEVVFAYRPLSFRIGLGLSLAALLVAAVFATRRAPLIPV